MTARRHHYVWQKYLEPWTTSVKKSKQLWCLRRDSSRPIPIDTKNVAVERDFYRRSDLQDGDTDFIRTHTFRPDTNPKLRELNEGWIARYERFHALAVLARSQADESQLKTLNELMITAEEDAYSKMESSATSTLAALQAGDVSFIADDQEAVSFYNFLVHQYFRTKAIQERTRQLFAKNSDMDRFDRTWPILRYIFVTNVAYSMFEERRKAPLQIIRAAPGTEFITSDQPVVNTHGAFAPKDKAIDSLEFYYPISPSRALIVSDHSSYTNIHGQELGALHVNYLNQTIELIARDQLFASSEQTLTSLAGYFRGTSDSSSSPSVLAPHSSP
jgi:hypothetical protein